MSDLEQKIDLFINQTNLEKNILASYLIALFDIPINYTSIKQKSFTESDLWLYLEKYLRLRHDLPSEKFELIKRNTILVIKKNEETDLLKLNNFQNSTSLYNSRMEITNYIYSKFKNIINDQIREIISNFDDKSKKILYIYVINFPSINTYSNSKQTYNFDETYIYYQDFLRNFKTLFSNEITIEDIINTLIKSGLYKAYDKLVSEFEYLANFLIEEILSEILKPYVKDIVINKTCKLKKILIFIKENQSFPSLKDCVKKLDLDIDDSEYLLEFIKNIKDVKLIETEDLKLKAKEAIKKLKHINLLDLIEMLKLDFNTASQVGNYLINKELIDDFPLITRSDGEDLDEKIKIFISYAAKDSNYYKIPQFGDYLQEHYPNVESLYFEKSIKLGDYPLDYMEQGIKWCNIFIWFHSTKSERSRAKDEYRIAYNLNKKIITITEDYNSLPEYAKVRWAVIYDPNVELLADKIMKDIKSEQFHSQVRIK